MTQREKIRYQRRVQREKQVQAYKDIIAIILTILFFISPCILEALVILLEKVGLL